MAFKRFDRKPDGFVLPSDFCRELVDQRVHEDCYGVVADRETNRLYTCCLVCKHHRKFIEIYGDTLQGDAS